MSFLVKCWPPLTVVLLFVGVLSSPSLGALPQAEHPELPRGLRAVDSLRTHVDFQEALKRLHELTEAHPGTVEILWRRAILWSDYGRSLTSEQQALSAYQQGLWWADRALNADPSSAWAHLAKAATAGRAALLAGSTKQSIQLSRTVKEHADRALDLDPRLAPAYYVRGLWHSEVAGLGIVARTIVRAVYGGLPEASFESAAADFQRAIDLEARVHNHLELGKVYLKMGKHDVARTQFRRALELPVREPFDLENKLRARTQLEKLQ